MVGNQACHVRHLLWAGCVGQQAGLGRIGDCRALSFPAQEKMLQG